MLIPERLGATWDDDAGVQRQKQRAMLADEELCVKMTDEQFNHLLAFISRNKENIFLELRHVKNDRDENTRALGKDASAIRFIELMERL